MKLIEAMKKVKELQMKADDLKNKVAQYCAISTIETPTYADQKRQISEWIQAHSDILKLVLRLRVAIQKTNLETDVAIEIGGKQVTKTIAEWIHRRRDLAHNELAIWNKLTDRGIKEGLANGPSGTPIEVKIVRFYDPSERDNKRDIYTSEPSIIDARLEVINAITDLIE